MLNKFVKPQVRRAVQRFGDWYERRNNESIAIATAMIASPPPLPVNYPSWYVGFLRECIRPQRHHLKEIKTSRRSITEATRRFDTLLHLLASDVPPLALSTAQEIGQIADAFLASTQATICDTWIGDVGLDFGVSSSFGRAGRLITCVVRMMKSHQCLELGTAYGLSAPFTLAALQRNGERGHLTTVEGGEPQFSRSSTMLQEKYADYVSCHKGMTTDVLPAIVPTLGTIDFVFHDAGHAREDHIADFGLVEPILASGSVMLIDDINWNDQRYYKGDPRAYAGWRAVVRNKRVERAVEVDGTRGLLLLR